MGSDSDSVMSGSFLSGLNVWISSVVKSILVFWTESTTEGLLGIPFVWSRWFLEWRKEEEYYTMWTLLIVGGVLVIVCAYYWLGVGEIPILRDYFLAESCELKVENAGPLKVGEDMVMTISGFIPKSKESDYEATKQYTERIFKSIVATIDDNEKERVQATKGYEDGIYGRIHISFPIRKSGTYRVELRYKGFLIPETPFEITIPPDFMSAEKSDVILTSDPVLITDSMPQSLVIVCKDRTGQPCSGECVRLDKFDFQASTENDTANCGKTLDFIGDRWKECLDASFSYQGYVGEEFSEYPCSVLLVLRIKSPNSYGVMDGHVTYNGKTLNNGVFRIVSLKGGEYERLEPFLKEPKPTNVVQLQAMVAVQIMDDIQKKHAGSQKRLVFPAVMLDPQLTGKNVYSDCLVTVKGPESILLIMENGTTEGSFLPAVKLALDDIKILLIKSGNEKQPYTFCILRKEFQPKIRHTGIHNDPIVLRMRPSHARLFFACLEMRMVDQRKTTQQE